MGECYKGTYKTNAIVTHSPLICFGGFGQPQCEYVEKCATENGMKKGVPKNKGSLGRTQRR